MVPGARFPIAALCALVLLLQACAAPTPALPRVVEIEPGRRTRVELVDGSSQRVFALQNASSGSRQAVYSDPAGDAMTKVVADQDLQRLLDVLAAKGLFNRATAAPPSNARDLLVVDHDGERWVWARLLPGMQQSELPFHEAKAYFLTAWNQAVAFHASSMSKEDLEAERARAQQNRQAVQRKLEGQDDPPRPQPLREVPPR